MARAKDFRHFGATLNAQAKALRRLVENEAPAAIGAIAVEFADTNFEKQGYQGSSFQKWAARKTTDKKGRDLTKYKRGRYAGRLTKLGRSNKGRALLVKSGRMRSGLRSKTGKGSVAIVGTAYAPTHNFGDKSRNIPQRQFVGASPILRKRIQAYFRRKVKKIISGEKNI